MSKSLLFGRINSEDFPHPVDDDRAVIVAMVNTATLLRACGSPKAARTASTFELMFRELLTRFDARSGRREFTKPERLVSATIADFNEPVLDPDQGEAQ